MNNFKAGDKVVCVRGANGGNGVLNVDQIYTVKCIDPRNNSRVEIEGIPRPSGDNYFGFGWDATRFELVPVQQEKPKTPAQEAGFVVGEQYLYTGDSFQWFVENSVITFEKDDGSTIPMFTGPSNRDGLRAGAEKKGDIIKGFAKLEHLKKITKDEPVKDIHVNIFYTTNIDSGTSTTSLNVDLTQEQLDKIVAIIKGE